ncbi:phosphatidylserine decarboxylase proenzyme, mitochondrial-like isoform X2 [Symsagittifera roscoffensis]|uniref:phosphatidylserine decarboxylase proenzyme, mitochondrial-like isoform X2 n=1 Tax=Symsagittifera roscoffensis TaxID=84072 RepID=UPI00307BA6AE
MPRSLLRKSLLAVAAASGSYGTVCYLVPEKFDSQLLYVYRKLPLKVVSYSVGRMMSVDIPPRWRTPIVGSFSRLIAADESELKECDLEKYSTLNQFFSRELKPGARIFQKSSHDSQVWCPSDGEIIQFRPVGSSMGYTGATKTEDFMTVKDCSFSLSEFLGPPLTVKENSTSVSSIQNRLCQNDRNCLYACAIYLSPSDCHRFYSPVDWKVNFVRHFSGSLLSVRPSILKFFSRTLSGGKSDDNISAVLSIQERCVMVGEWKHGFFAFTAVGASNVGSIDLNHFPQIRTNIRPKNDKLYEDHMPKNDSVDLKLNMGDEVGKFNLGSTIVLVFEAPRGLKLREVSQCKIGQHMIV